MSSDFMVHLPQDRGEIVDDRTADFGRQIVPDVPRLDGHAPSLPSAVATNSSSASMLSLVCVVGRSLRGPRFVTCRGRSSVRPNRHSTRAQDSGHVDRSIEISRNRLPLSGCVASTTSTSAKATSSLALAVSFNPHAGRDRLEKSTTNMATAERRLSRIKYWTTCILGRHKSLNL